MIDTERLTLQPLTHGDAAFILRLLNEPSFIRNIGDRGVRTIDDARGYLDRGPLADYARLGYGLWCVRVRTTGARAGICGLLKRDALPDPDLGFAFLPEFWLQGYAAEATRAVIAFAQETLGLRRLLAITNPANDASVRVLERNGLKFERLVRLTPDAAELKLFALGGE